jgi:uncharacterized phage-like protein YoqJ
MQIPLFTEPTVIAATGHRPVKLGGYGYNAANRLRSFARSELAPYRPLTVITGMALGWDQAVAGACVDLEIPFVAAVPFAGQEAKWPVGSQHAYVRLLSRATKIVVVNEGGFSVQSMHRRNRYMVDCATQILALWDGSSGGTSHCVAYAASAKKPINNCWARWSCWSSTT